MSQNIQQDLFTHAEASAQDLATEQALEYIRQTYRVPARVGMRVRYSGGIKIRMGTIRGAQNAKILVHFDEHKSGNALPLHPTWNVEYLDGPNGTAAGVPSNA